MCGLVRPILVAVARLRRLAGNDPPRGGYTRLMLVLLGRAAARLRHGRAVHTPGQAFVGTMRSETERPPWLPLPPNGQVVARLSKGAGTPGAVPDVLGLALRLPAPTADRPWDVLLSSAGSGPLGRAVPWPARSWSRARFSSIAPWRVADRLWWLLARLGDEHRVDPPGAALPTVASLPITLTLFAVTASGHRCPAATVTLTDADADGRCPEWFDPLGTTPAGTELVPRWLTTLRDEAYRGSRDGRGLPG